MPETKAQKKRKAALIRQYGKKKGESISYAMENSDKKPKDKTKKKK